MSEFAGVLLGVVGIFILIAAFGGGGWVVLKNARASGRRTYMFLGGAMLAIAAYASIAAVVALIQQFT
ncbi:hypothetical protein [Demetria terragena]|uniref:hypothetical protein n=1 Tax=Demetria terragena TaxID=63959 RepID=UPI0003A7EA2C|nr:hypothetical protein [Demetria terragena]